MKLSMREVLCIFFAVTDYNFQFGNGYSIRPFRKAHTGKLKFAINTYIDGGVICQNKRTEK